MKKLMLVLLVVGLLMVVGTANAMQAEPSAVPIPGAVWLLGSGIAALIGIRRKFKK